MPHNTTLGRAGEQRAADFLHDDGYEIVDRNWRCSDGEVDIVAVRREVLAVVEVKTRTSRRYGHPLEALDGPKTDRLRRLALLWARGHPDGSAGRRGARDVLGGRRGD